MIQSMQKNVILICIQKELAAKLVLENTAKDILNITYKKSQHNFLEKNKKKSNLNVNLNNFVYELINNYDEFKFLQPAIDSLYKLMILTRTSTKTIHTSNLNKIAPMQNYFNISKTEKVLINAKFGATLFQELLGINSTQDLLYYKIKMSLYNLILCKDKQDLDKNLKKKKETNINKEVSILKILMKRTVINIQDPLEVTPIFEYVVNICRINLILEVMKKAQGMALFVTNITLNYTDMAYKLGISMLELFFSETCPPIFSYIYHLAVTKTLQNDDHLNFISEMFLKDVSLEVFIKQAKRFKNTSILEKGFEEILDTYELFALSYIFNLLKFIVFHQNFKEETVITEGYVRNQKKYVTAIIKLGSVFLESYIAENIFSIHKITDDYTIPDYKKKIMLNVSNEILEETFKDLTFNRPFLHQKTLKNIIVKKNNIRKSAENLFIHICKTRIKNFIRYNANMHTKINEKTYLNDSKNLYTKFAIDKHYVYYFLNLIKKHIQLQEKNQDLTFIEKLNDHEDILLLYQLDKNSIFSFFHKYNKIPEIAFIFKDFFVDVLDLNNNSNDSLHYFHENIYTNNTITQKLKNILREFIDNIYNKIFSYKLFIKGLLVESIVYSNFRYFICDSFIDTRGRCYYTGFYLNIQSYPITKAFIKLYNPAGIKNITDFNNVLPVIKNRLKNSPQLKKNITFNHYNRLQKVLQITYLYSLFNKNNISKSDLIAKLNLWKKHILNNFIFFDILDYLKLNVKKVKKLYVVHSMICNLLLPQAEIQNYFEMDATASGLQMTAMLFHHRKLAEICKLVDVKNNSKNVKDIYESSAEYLLNQLNLLDSFTYQIIKILKHNQIIYALNNIFDSFLFQEENYSLDKLLNEINKNVTLKPYIEKLEKYFAENNSILKHYNWLVYHIENTIAANSFSKKDPENYKKTLYYLITMSGLKMMYLRNTYQWLDLWLFDRDFFKKPIMTFGYNATSYRRKEDWREKILELNNYEYFTELIFLINIAENIFSRITIEFLTPAQWLRDLGVFISKNIEKIMLNDKKITQDLDKIIITNTFLTINLSSYKEEKGRIDVKGYEFLRKHQISVLYPKFIPKIVEDSKKNNMPMFIKEQDYTSLARKFAPNFIHSMDAYLVHLFKKHLYNINKEISDYNLFINHLTNHDNFACTAEPFLFIILWQCYNTVYSYDYINTLCHTVNFENILEYKKSKIKPLLPEERLPYDIQNPNTPVNLKLSKAFVKF